jgi:hypothetical protein
MDPIMTLLLAAAISIGLFFLLRNINLWYFRINEGIEKLDKQIELLEQIKDHLSSQKNSVKPGSGSLPPSEKVPIAKVLNYTKSNNLYTFTNGNVHEIVKEGDCFYFEFGDKKYYYEDIASAENSLNEVEIDKEPSKKGLVSIKNK